MLLDQRLLVEYLEHTVCVEDDALAAAGAKHFDMVYTRVSYHREELQARLRPTWQLLQLRGDGEGRQ
jgi:hypothetical protein